jgi:hypothetical protein
MQVGGYKIDDGTCIKVYDPAKQELIAVYQSYKEAGKYLGLSGKIVHDACVHKSRKFSPFLKKEVAIRISKK